MNQSRLIILFLSRMAQMAVLCGIRLYQKTHLLRSPSCRFYPTCSEYTRVSVERFGVANGLLCASQRICRCHPWNLGGVDLVPEQLIVGNMIPLFGQLKSQHEQISR